MKFVHARLIIPLAMMILLAAPVNAVHLEEGRTIPIVAAFTTLEGEAGVVLNATVIVTEGSGHVFVDTQPYTQVDLQGSTRIAALVASDITGIDPSQHDFYYIIEVTSPLIGGPSAGGALTVATIAEIKDWDLKEGVVMTGTINPDGSIGAVGGIPYKLDAAGERGAGLFIVPEGQTNVIIVETTLVREGPFVVQKDNPVQVDIVERGRRQNVKVVEVVDIEDAVELFTGHVIHRPVPSKGVWSAEYLDVLRPLARAVLDEADLLYQRAAEETTSYPGILGAQQDLLKTGNKQFNEQEYYAATNTALLIMKNLKFILWSEEYQAAEDQNDYLIELLEEVSQQVNQSRKELEEFKAGGVMDVDSVGAAEVRVVMAERLLEEARSAGSVDQYLDTLAFASMRAETVKWWLSLVNSDHTTSDIALKERAGWYVGTASSVVTYARTVTAESGGFHGVSNILNEASESLERAEIEFERGYYSGATFDSLLATVQASTAISLLGSASVESKISRSADAARLAIEDTRAAGIEPVLAVSAYEFADSLDTPSQKIVEYNYARVIAKTTVQLTEVANKSWPAPTGTPIPLKTPVPLMDENGGIEIPAFSMLLGILALFIVVLVLRSK